MSDLAYTFTIDGMPENTFTVLDFTGEERLSAPYRFVLNLVSSKKDIDLETALSANCRLAIDQDRLYASKTSSAASPRNKVFLHGIVIQLEVMRNLKRTNAPELFFFRAVMSHPLFWMSIDNHNQVYCGKSIPEILEEELKQAGLKPNEDFQIAPSQYRGNSSDDRDSKDFPRVSYITQYRESSLNFIDRLMQREGIYYYFTHTEQSNTVHLVDNKNKHPEADPKKLSFDPGATLDRGACIQQFRVEFNRSIKKVLLRDYNPKRPDNFVDAEHNVSEHGIGQTSLFGENFSNEADAQNLARLRAELFLSRHKAIHGVSTASFLRPGHRFELEHHFISNVNGPYLLTAITHRGSQALEASHLLEYQEDGLDELDYSNTFTAIPADVQFRPELTAEKVRIFSTIPAHIDHDEINDTGAYKVKMPFDLSNRDDGKASCWCRFMKQYVGTNFGQHYPLRKGTEVMMGFIDGDPDRPYIAGAMENATHTSVTNSKDVGCERLANGNFKMFSSKGEKNLFCDAPEGSLAAFTKGGISINGNSISFTTAAKGAFAGMAENGSDNKTVTLGQEQSANSLGGGSITPTVVTGQTQAQTNIVTADEQTVRSGTFYDEQDGARHETQSGDRFVKNTGSTRLEETAHNSRMTTTRGQMIVNSVNDRIMETHFQPDFALKSGGGSSNNSAKGSTAGFTMPSIEAIKEEYSAAFRNSDSELRRSYLNSFPALGKLTRDQTQEMENELQTLRKQSADYPPAELDRRLQVIVGKYFNEDEAHALLDSFNDQTRLLLQNLKSDPDMNGAASSDANGVYFAEDKKSLWTSSAKATGGDASASSSVATAKASAEVANAGASATFITAKIEVVGIALKLSATIIFAFTFTNNAAIDTAIKVGWLGAELKLNATETNSKTVYMFGASADVRSAEAKLKTLGATLAVLAGGVDAKLEGQQKVDAALSKIQTNMTKTAVDANKNKIQAIANGLIATGQSISALKTGVNAVQSQVETLATHTNVTDSNISAATMETKASVVATSMSKVSTGLTTIGTNVANIKT